MVCALLASCGPNAANFTVVMTPSKTTAVTRDWITVAVDCSRENLMKTKLTITNRSRETIVISPGDIALRIGTADAVLLAAEDYKSYVAMRFTEAKKECGRGKESVRCRRELENFFRPFFKARPFNFGIVMPGKELSGYIAFNLPDPFNRTTEARLLADSLKSMMKLLDGRIEINIAAMSKDRRFVFPVNITTYSGADRNPLTIMRYF